jgi:uracil-DNA glycosylase family 4
MSDTKVEVKPRGGPGAKYMIVFSHPTKDDLQVAHFGRSGGSANEVLDALEEAEIPVEECYFTAMVRNGIGSKPKPPAEDIEFWSEKLDKEIEEIKPQLIISLGAEVFKRIMKTNMKVGDYLGEIIDSPYGKLLANYSPGMVTVQDPTKRPEFRDIFMLAKKAVDNNLQYQEYTYKIVDSPEENIAILKDYISRGMFSIGYDAEWYGSKFTDDEVMYEFQYSCEKHVAVVLNISKDGVTENRELLDTMKLILEHPKADRLGWNIRADDIRLTYRGFKLADETLGFDGMKAVAFFDSRMAKGLETGIKKFTNYEPYYVPFYRKMKEHKLPKAALAKMKFFEPDTYYHYCAGDAVAHREACLRMREGFPKELKGYYDGVYLPLTNYFLDMELTGIPIDLDVLNEITDKYLNKYNSLREEMDTFMDNHFGIKGFNPNSSLQKKEFLFSTLALPPAYYTKAGKSPKPRVWYEKQSPQTQRLFSPSTNGKSLSTIKFELEEDMEENDSEDLKVKHKAVELLLNISRIGVFATKFLSKKGVVMDESELEDGDDDEPLKQSYWAAIANDGRVHASFFELLKNFRASSSPNVQNPASKVLAHIPNIFVPGYSLMTKDEQANHNSKLPDNIRNIFYSGSQDYHWVELDIAGADLAIMAFLSRDEAFIKDIRAGNFHQTKMREYFQDPGLSKKDVSKYVIAKSITFRVSYTAGLDYAAIPIQAEIYAENGLHVPLELIQYALETWKRYSTYMGYREECNAEVNAYERISNARGMQLSYEKTDNFGIKAGWLNESLAFPVASELALFMWHASVNIRKFLKSEGLWMKYIYPVNVVHDANYWIAHKDLMKDNYLPEILRHVFCDYTRIATGDKLGCELVVSDRWKGKKKFFEKETVWNNQTQSWDWSH